MNDVVSSLTRSRTLRVGLVAILVTTVFRVSPTQLVAGESTSPASFAPANFRSLAEKQQPCIDKLNTLAEEIRRDLARGSNRFNYSAFSLPALSPEFDARIARYRRDKTSLQKELLARVQSFSSKNQNEERNRQAIDLFTQENASRYAALEKERKSLRGELVKAASTGRVVVKGPFADALSQQFSEAQQQIEVWRNYRDYQTAVYEPGLAPEQRRLLFDAAVEKLDLPLPEGELSR